LARYRPTSARLTSSDPDSPGCHEVTPAEQPVVTAARSCSVSRIAACSVVLGSSSAKASPP